jgi:Sulfatase
MTAVVAVCRALVILFWLATSAYAFLSAVPFVYEQFLQPGLVPALVAFVRWHRWLTLACVPVAAMALWADIRIRGAYLRGGGLIWVLCLAGAAAAVTDPLAAAQPGMGAIVLSVAALVPVWWLAAIDVSLAAWPDTHRSGDLLARDAAVALAGALAVTVLYAAMGVATTGAFDGVGSFQSTAAHGLLFAAVFAAITVVRAIADLTSKPAQWEALCASILLMVLTGAATALVVLPAVSARDAASRIAVTIFGTTVGLVLAARGVRAGRELDRDGVALVLGGLLPAWAIATSHRRRALWAVVVLAVAIAFRSASGAMDWNFAVAKLGAVVVWFLVLATAINWTPTRVTLPPAVPFLSSAAILVGYLLTAGRLPFGPVSLDAATASSDAWVVGDPSFRTLRDWLHRPGPAATSGDPTSASEGIRFFDFLQVHTNIGRSVAVAPVPVELARLEGPPAARRPHVFVFVVDSLRRDYLSPYNPGVSFTPAIQRFAADSTVYTNAFTRYGATGLSVPSIWVGGMVLHKQYVMPFAPMNALHALLAHHRYARRMSMDNIVDLIMPRDTAVDEIDRGRGVAEFRLCASLDNLRGRLDTIASSPEPTFTWTLPQDIHVAVINREGNRAVDEADYGDLHAPYASRIRRFDHCFGAFVGDLKARGLYDESVIVLTSDHGDSLGEEGRWGHAYTIYPEVVQVPLIVHLPVSARAALATRPEARAFTTDITPTLYTLLGHRVTADAPIFGRSLVWPKAGPPPARPPFGLVASSYGSVYGWIDEAGSTMYIADGVALRDYVYELNGSAAGVSQPVTAAARAEGQRRIRDGVQLIADFYRFRPPAP